MQAIINFFEYILDGWVYAIYAILMIIFSLACLGVVGDKVSKKRHAEMLAKREALAKQESDKAQALIKKQAESYGVNNTLDPTVKKQETNNAVQQPSQDGASGIGQQPVQEVVPSVVDSAPASLENVSSQDVVVLDAPATTPNDGTVVDNITPIVDNTSDEAVKADVPSFLVINEDGTSNITS